MATAYDAVVIGAGPGGYGCAIRLAQNGKKVALVEKHKLGGECLNYGCIPSKALIFASTLYENIQKGRQFGIEVKGVSMNMNTLQDFRKNLVGKLTQGVGFLLKQNKVDVIEGEATFTSEKTISVNGKKIEADSFVIATGSSAVQIPGFETDGDRAIGSKEALELAEIPKALVVLGGGVIGCELGTYFAKLGTKVSIVEMMPQLLPGTDRDLVMVVEKALKARGVDIYTGAKARKLTKGKEISLAIEHGGKKIDLKADRLLVTIGRRANTGSLGLDKIGVKVDEKGFIITNPNLQTTIDNIFAIGDVVGQPLLAHKATHDGLHVADVISMGAYRVERPISWAIFTDPEIAGVGLNREQAKEQGDVIVGKFPFAALGRSLAAAAPDGFTKIIADKKTKQVKGVFIVGEHASDLISEAALAVTHKMNIYDLANTIHPHPTLPESLMEAAEAAHGKAIHIFNRR